MARGGITLNDITQAAILLQERRQNSTVDSIRQLLGTGNKTTITQLLREWRSQQHEAGGALPGDLWMLVTGLWEQLNQQTEQRMENYTLESWQETQVLKEKIVQLPRKNQALQPQNHQEENKVENAQFHALVIHIQANLERYQEALQQLRSEQILLIEKQQMTFTQERKQLQQQLFQQQQHMQELEMQCQFKTQALNALEGARMAHEKQLQKYQAERREQIILSDRYEQLQQNQQIQAIEFTPKREMFNTLEKQYAVVNLRAEQLEKNLLTAEDKIETLRNEKLFLAQEKAELQGYLQKFKKTGS